MFSVKGIAKAFTIEKIFSVAMKGVVAVDAAGSIYDPENHRRKHSSAVETLESTTIATAVANLSQYELVMRTIFGALAAGHVQNFDGVGFGAKLLYPDDFDLSEPKKLAASVLSNLEYRPTSHIFALRNPGNVLFTPRIVGVELMISAYKKAMDTVSVDEPTCFSGVFKEYTRRAHDTAEKLNGQAARTVLIIITNGIYHDEAEFINAVITVSYIGTLSYGLAT